MPNYPRTIIIPEDKPKPPVDSWTPTRPPSIESDVLVPFGKALVTGLVGGMVVAMGTYAITNDLLVRSVDYGILAAGATFAATWFWKMGWAESTLNKVEQAAHIDINRDGAIGPRDIPVNTGAARREANRAADLAEAELVRATMLEFVQLCLKKGGTSEAKLGISTSDKSRAKYAAKRDLLIEMGIGAWNDPARAAAGWHLRVPYATTEQIIGRYIISLPSPATDTLRRIR